MAEESDLERTEPASSRRIEKAREEGQVPQSRELMAFMVLATGAASLWVLGGWFSQKATGLVRQGLSFDRHAAFDPGQMAVAAVGLSVEAMVMMAPLFLLTMAGAVLAPFIIGGWVFSTRAFQIDFSRMDPIRGLGRLFTVQSIAELVKALLKALLVGGIIWWVVHNEQDRLFALLGQSVETGVSSFARLLLVALLALVAGVAVIALLDVPFQLWRYYDGLKMTREELRQEHKELEGDPQVKGRIRSQQREMARRRMMAAVPKADVVVTNPTHFAVALKYDAATMAAPQVVAKGMNLVAARIRELAEENDVPILEAPPLARALHKHAEIGEQIPAGLYTAVAEVMAYVYQLGEFLRSGGRLLPPSTPAAIAVPDGLDPGSPDDLPAEAVPA